MLSPVNHEISKYFLNHINEIPLFSIKETNTHYLVAIDLPSLPSGEVRVREKNETLYVEGLSDTEKFQKKTYFQFHNENKTCRIIYQDGVLWLAMPKSAEINRLGEAS